MSIKLLKVGETFKMVIPIQTQIKIWGGVETGWEVPTKGKGTVQTTNRNGSENYSGKVNLGVVGSFPTGVTNLATIS